VRGSFWAEIAEALQQIKQHGTCPECLAELLLVAEEIPRGRTKISSQLH